ncbi:MAG TPA: helix-turn-helix domain-containing protein [Puia sp.]|nr:helix-turn-helix domain-containing protein [Puia sp.]
MKTRSVILTPLVARTLATLGANIKLARLRRRLRAEQVCERAGISRPTLWKIENGSPNVAAGAYTQVLFILGLEKDLLTVGADDELGRKLLDAGLEIKRRGPKRNKSI